MKRIMHPEMKEKRNNNPLDLIKGKITIVDELPFRVADDDPVLLRKREECIKSFYETPWPEEVLKRM